MTRHRRHAALLLLLLHLAGCGGYHLPDPADADSPDPYRAVQVGSPVLVTTISGSQVEGRVVRMTVTEIELGGRENYAHENVTLARDEIARIELRDQTDGQIEGAWMAGIILALAGGLLYFLSHSGLN